MASRVEIAELARIDLKEIWSYIAEYSYEAANRTIEELTQKFRLLAENPSIGKNQSQFVVDIRSFPYKNTLYFIFRLKTAWKSIALFTARETSKTFLKILPKD